MPVGREGGREGGTSEEKKGGGRVMAAPLPEAPSYPFHPRTNSAERKREEKEGRNSDVGEQRMLVKI